MLLHQAQTIHCIGEKHPMKYILPAIFFLFTSVCAKAQNTVVSGTITDARTNQPLPFVAVSFPGTSIGTNSDANGHYRISTGKTYTELKFSLVGYKPVVRTIVAGKEEIFNVKMQPDVQTLEAV